MKMLRRSLIRLASAAFRRRDEERLREEIDGHLALQTEANIRAGMSPADARRQALLKFGTVEAVKERYRDEQRLPLLDDAVQDVRYTFRQLRKAPLFTLAATLSLAIGIGANAAVFTVIERVLLRPLPVSDPQDLVFVTDQRILEQQSPRFSYPFYLWLRDNTVLDGVAARFRLPVNATVSAHVGRASGELVSGSYFGVVGAGTQTGRPLSPEDDRTPGAHPVAVISDGFWQRSFASDPSVLGRAVRINDHPFTIVGVAAKGFTGTDVGFPTDIWIPLIMQREVGRDLLTDPRTNWLEIIGRLRSGVSRERATSELTAYLHRSAPDVQAPVLGRQLVLVPADKGNVRGELGPALKVLLALTALALALVCVNVASLLAVRSAAREKEIAVRLALGARRSRLAQQFLIETAVLVAIGATAGLLTAPWAARLLIAAQPYTLEIDPSPDVRVFLFGLAASAAAALVVALAPILAARKVQLTQAFDSFPGRSGTTRGVTMRDLIVTSQIAMSLAMLISAALLVQSLQSLKSVDPGFRADSLLLASLDPKSAGYDSRRVEGFWRDALERLNQVRGAQSVSLAGTVPLSQRRQRQPWLNPASGGKVSIDTAFVAPGYFRTLDIPLLRGREFDEFDGKTSRPVVIVNERVARMFWPDRDPMGKGVRLPDGGNPVAEVVGLVKDVKYGDLRGESVPMFYRPLFQTRSTDAMTLHVRATGDASALAGTIRRELQLLDANVPLFDIRTLEDELDASFAQTRQAAVLTGGFGILALLLSAIGVYGVTALMVTRQTRDIGIRLALGAERRDVLRAIGRRGLSLVMMGLGLGLVGSFAFTRTAGALLFGVSPGDSRTFALMAALLAVVSLAAIYVPAAKATRLDAVAAIRRE